MKELIIGTLLLFSVNVFAAISVERYNGTIYINDKAYTKELIIKNNDSIRVEGKKSFIQLKLEDHSIMLFKEGEFKLKKIAPQKENIVELKKGVLYHYLIKSKDVKFKVNTKYASMGIRGTKYMIEEKESSSYVCVCDGTVSVFDYINKQLKLINKDQEVLITKDKTGDIKSTKQQMIDMNFDIFQEMGYPLINN